MSARPTPSTPPAHEPSPTDPSGTEPSGSDPTPTGTAPSDSAPSAATRVFEALKLSVLDGTLGSGAFITEGEVADHQGVSRTPVREALLRLESEGLVRLYPKRGALVTPLTAKDTHDVLEARAVLEVWAGRRMWPHREGVLADLREQLDAMLLARESGDQWTFSLADRTFHEILVAATGNEVMTRLYHSIRERQQVILARQVGMSPERMDRAVAQHSRLLHCLEHGDEAGFLEVTEEHVTVATKVVEEHR